MDKPEICKICDKRFANGKALGGHMRSHFQFAKVHIPIIPTKPKEPSLQPPPTSSSFDSSLNCSKKSYTKFATNPVGVSTLANPSGGIGSTEAQSESVSNPTRRRSKRLQKPVEKVSELMHSKAGDKPYPDPGRRVSSSTFASDCNNNLLSDEDVATTLLMLSYEDDKIRKGKGVALEEEDQVVVDASIDKFVEENEDLEEGEVRVEKEVGEDEEEDEEEEPNKLSLSGCNYNETNASDLIRIPNFSTLPPLKQSKPSFNGKFRCEVCDKGFKSYQALGGHMANHKRVRPSGNGISFASNKELAHQLGASGGLVVGSRVFKCSFCDKKFESGQALGGHKKVHFPYLDNNLILNPKASDTTSTSAVAASRVVKNLIDLNLLPPEVQEDF